MAEQLTYDNREYYQRRYAEEIARSVGAADMTAAMPHRRLARLYSALLLAGERPELRAVGDDGRSRPGQTFMLSGDDDV